MNKNRTELLTNFPIFAETCLKIRTKTGDIAPFRLNKAQQYIDQKLNEQLRATGKVRALILKGRQQGCSTLIAGRYYHKVIQRFGTKVFILTHREDATNNLYKLVQRYHDNLPSFLKPSTGVANAKELVFDKLDSGYGIGTAGGGTVGRSDTIQLLHGSEVAFWQNTDEISSGIMQTVADSKDTEIILESTANGVGNMFHKMTKAAMNKLSEYQLIFVPWHWQEEYKLELTKDFQLTEEETELKRMYKLDDKQIAWRRNKITNLAGGEWQFKQEYPFTPNEAFQASHEDSLIHPQFVTKARHTSNIHKDDQLIIGVDPAYKGKDKTAIIWRSGRVQHRHELHDGLDTMQVAGRIIQIINHWHPDKMFIDLGGIGAGIYDRLKELGYANLVIGVYFGQKAEDQARFFNKRAEMWGRLAQWFKDGGVKIEDDDLLESQVTLPGYNFKSNGAMVLQSKDELEESPDLGDALALTFAFKVPNKAFKERYGFGKINKTTQGDWNVYS
jgi:hypothetical protein